MFPDLVKSSILAIVISMFCVWLIEPIAEQIGLIDHPGGRKHHKGSTPVIGGIAIFFGFCFGLLTLHISLSNYRGLLGGAAIAIVDWCSG